MPGHVTRGQGRGVASGSAGGGLGDVAPPGAIFFATSSAATAANHAPTSHLMKSSASEPVTFPARFIATTPAIAKNRTHAFRLVRRARNIGAMR